MLSNWHNRYHSKTTETFLSPFAGRKQLLPFYCQQGWGMEVKWSAFHYSKWKSILGKGRNTYLHLSPMYWRAVTAPEWMATYIKLGKRTKCLKDLTCAKVVVGWLERAHGQKNHHLASVSQLSVWNVLSNCTLQLPEKTTGSLTSIKSHFGFDHVYLFSHLISLCPHLKVFV